MDESRIKLLQRMAIFGGIRSDVLQLVLDEANILTVPEGDFFFREDDRGYSMYVLESGEVAILKSRDGRDYQLNQLAAGDCFGEMALIDMCPRSASVRAIKDCSAIEVSSGMLQAVYRKDLEQFTMIHMNMGREVSRRLRAADLLLLQAMADNRIPAGEYTFRP